VAVTPAGRDHPTLVLDAGTGIRTVTTMLDGTPFRGVVALTHLHWDHLQGLPFFAAGDREDARVRLLVPEQQTGESTFDVLSRAMSPPHFPIGPDGLRGDWTFDAIDAGHHQIDGFTITARDVPHKGGRTFGYRVEADGTSFAYVPDHRPAGSGPERASAVELASGVDLLIHDAQFLDHEHPVADLYGHATCSQAIALAREAEVGELVLFHHAPGRTDDQLTELLAGLDTGSLTVTLAVEGEHREVGAPVTGRRVR
jgi:ribonuclease BN (tRNA processing enzyme)